MALQGRRYPSARDLAETLEVSRRTIYRDFTALEAAGLPVLYDSVRQGYLLASSSAFHGLALDEMEATALLVLAENEGRAGSLGLSRPALSGARKVVASLPKSPRERVQALAELLVSRQPVLRPPPQSCGIYDLILESLRQRQQLRIWYHDPGGEQRICTKVNPYRLVIGLHHWTLIGRSSVHREVVPFRLARIERAELTGDPASVPPRFRLDRYLGQSWFIERGPERHQVHLRFSSLVGPEISEVNWHASQRTEHLPDGRLDLLLELDGLAEIVGWILGFGDDVEVIAPGKLRNLVHEQAQRVADRHAAAEAHNSQEPASVPYRKRAGTPEASMGS